ncbi:MAG: hypothetical protein JWN16_177 [Alphaproteobacteria bacterium]|nr:hypothetical protein [Alphaproteobacteria bacterium]
MSRHLFLLPVLMAMATPALAGPREDTMAGISRCASLPDDRAFLDCIYGAAQPMRTRLGLPAAPVAQQRLVPPAYAATAPVSVPPARAMARVSKDTTSTLGNVLGSNTSPGWLEAYTFDGHGLFTVTLSNGEIWRQDPSDPARAHWNGRASDYGVKLAKDAGGRSGQLFVRGDDPLYRVIKLR